MARGREQFARYRTIINGLEKFVRIFPHGFRMFLWDHMRNVRGKKGIAFRYILLKTIAKKCGDNVAVFTNVYILNPQNLEVGSNVSIQPFCYLECGNVAGIEIGNDVSIAHGASIIATNHGFDSVSMPIKDQPLVEKKVEIGNDVWIGAKATVLAGRIIGDRVVIAANAVVAKNVPSKTVCAGVPAKIIRNI